MDDNWGSERRRETFFLEKRRRGRFGGERSNEISRKVSPRLPVLIALRESAPVYLAYTHEVKVAEDLAEGDDGWSFELSPLLVSAIRRREKGKNRVSKSTAKYQTTFNRSRRFSSEGESGTFSTATTVTSSSTTMTTIHKYAS